jgi:hypothetical protein
MQVITSWTNEASHLISGTVRDGLHVAAGLVAGLGKDILDLANALGSSGIAA